ncbi:MAG TPA: hypothetical protein VNM69_01125 [Bacillus sp. (in: firmicutes)]|uniref:hypothetical protein n=1 Tax=Bacillus litorisediminis TaxID=2922713 RepID=UPI001FAC104E|nr:hypothetical protein [Bacillus litorisediminis]HWO74499.1 hypothetical protein [Bacillus sp. (in: firmicutes)]
MPDREPNVESANHPDTKKESIISDPGAYQMGVIVSTNKLEPKQENNPLHLSAKTNDKMKDFERLMRGTPADEQ